MKIERNIIEKVANGETVLKGKTVEIAKRILNEKLQSRFMRYAYFYKGNGKDLNDIQDCILDFSCEGTQIIITDVPYRINPSGKLVVKSMTAKGCLKKLFHTMTDFEQYIDILDGKEFKIKFEQKLYRISYTMLHYCFAKGRITEQQCLDMMRI